MHSDTVARVVAGAAVLVAWSQCAAAGKCSNSQIVVVTDKLEMGRPLTILKDIVQVPVWLAYRLGKTGNEYTLFDRVGGASCESDPHTETDDCKAVESILGKSKKIKIYHCARGESLDKTVLDIFTWASPTCKSRNINVKSQKYKVEEMTLKEELKDYVKKVESYCGGCEKAPDPGTAKVTTAYAGPNVTMQGRSIYPKGAEIKYRCKGDQTDKTMKCTDEKWSPVDCPKPTDSSKSTTGDKNSTNLPLYIGLAIGILIIAIGVVATILLVVRRKKKAASSDPNSPSAGGPGGKPGLGFSNPNTDQSMVEVSVAAPSSSAEPSVPISSRHNWPIKQVTRSQMDKSPSAKANLSAKSVKEKTETSGKGSGKEGIPRSLKVPASPKVPGSPKSQGSPKITLTIPVSSKEGSPEQSSILKKK